MTTQTSTKAAYAASPLLPVAWIGTLLTSFLINIARKELFGGAALTAFLLRLGITVILILLTFVWQDGRPLRRYWVMILVLLAADIADATLRANQAWLAFFNSSPSWFVSSLGAQLPRLLLTVFAWITLVLMGLKRKDYFLVKGQLDAPEEPVGWLGEKKSRPWTEYGRQFAAMMFIVTLLIMGIGLRPSADSLIRVISLLPAALVFAMMNAFNENFAARASLLSHLLPQFGKGQSLALTAFYFGIWHYYGAIPGVMGVLTAAFLGWISAKAMVETKGFLWSWMMQVPMDLVVFASFAMSAIPGV